ncbi:MAG: DNA-protecting protein DprA, partial [Acinetobacter sp.]|nr:DNA-protecting protein DprA [Acinetobacter sp.]
MLNHLSKAQIDTITLWYLVQHSLSSFYKLEKYFAGVEHAVNTQNFALWHTLGLHKSHLQRLAEFQSEIGQQKFQQLLHSIQKNSDFILL